MVEASWVASDLLLKVLLATVLCRALCREAPVV
jgi:hypothetical protein